MPSLTAFTNAVSSLTNWRDAWGPLLLGFETLYRAHIEHFLDIFVGTNPLGLALVREALDVRGDIRPRVLQFPPVTPEEASREVERITRLLETLVLMKRLTKRELERRLGASAGTTYRLFGATMELKYRHIVEILDILDIRLSTFFQIAYETQTPVEEGAAQILAQAGKLSVRAAPAEPIPHSQEELERAVEASLRRLGLISKSKAAASKPAASKPAAKRQAGRRRPRGRDATRKGRPSS